MSGTLLGLADPVAGSGSGSGGSGLAPYHGVDINLARAAGRSLLCGVPPVGMLAIAIAGPRRRRHWVWAAGCAALACLTAGWPALPGAVAAIAAAWPPTRRQIT